MEVIHHLRSCCTHCFQNGPTRWKWLIEIYWNIPKSMTWCKGRTSQFYSQRPAISNSWGFGCAIACPGRRLSWSMAAAGAHFISKKHESFTRHGHGSTLAGLHDDFNIWYMIYIYIMYIHIIYQWCVCIYNIQYYIYIFIYILYNQISYFTTSRSLVLVLEWTITNETVKVLLSLILSVVSWPICPCLRSGTSLWPTSLWWSQDILQKWQRQYQEMYCHRSK